MFEYFTDDHVTPDYQLFIDKCFEGKDLMNLDRHDSIYYEIAYQSITDIKELGTKAATRLLNTNELFYDLIYDVYLTFVGGLFYLRQKMREGLIPSKHINPEELQIPPEFVLFCSYYILEYETQKHIKDNNVDVNSATANEITLIRELVAERFNNRFNMELMEYSNMEDYELAENITENKLTYETNLLSKKDVAIYIILIPIIYARLLLDIWVYIPDEELTNIFKRKGLEEFDLSRDNFMEKMKSITGTLHALLLEYISFKTSMITELSGDE